MNQDPVATDLKPIQRTSPRVTLILIGLFILSFAIRLYDITDLPLDFHPTRQLFTAIVARGLYYEMQPPDSSWQRELALGAFNREEREPPSIDGLAALSYLALGKEVLWLPRAFSAVFWVLGGIAIFLLSRKLTNDTGGIAATAIYLFLPYGVIASRSFQPDPLMTSLIVFSWWGMYEWLLERRWKWVILSGTCAGLAIFFKSLAAFSILGAFLGLWMVLGFKKLVTSKQFWVMVLLTCVPALGYMLNGLLFSQGWTSLFSLRFFPNLWLQPAFYLQWFTKAQSVAGLGFLVLGIIGIFYFNQRNKLKFVVGLWLGYVIFGFVFAYYFGTHDYYHLSLIPLVSISFAPIGAALWDQLGTLHPGRLAKTTVGLILLAGLASNLWNIRTVFHRTDYRPELAVWEQIGEEVGHNSSVIALTQDYGYRLEYFSWINPARYWPYRGDTALRELAGLPQPEFAERFAQLTRGMDFFLVTDLEEFAAQKELNGYLNANFPILFQSPTYSVFDLRGDK